MQEKELMKISNLKDLLVASQRLSTYLSELISCQPWIFIFLTTLIQKSFTYHRYLWHCYFCTYQSLEPHRTKNIVFISYGLTRFVQTFRYILDLFLFSGSTLTYLSRLQQTSSYNTSIHLKTIEGLVHGFLLFIFDMLNFGFYFLFCRLKNQILSGSFCSPIINIIHFYFIRFSCLCEQSFQIFIVWSFLKF